MAEGARANNMVLEACPLLFFTRACGVYGVQMCCKKGTGRLLDFYERGKHSLRGEDAALLFFDNILRADEGSGFSLLGRIAEIVRVKYMF